MEGYQLLPCLANDLVCGGDLPYITGGPVPVDITPQSFILEYATLYPSDTRLRFGPSAAEHRIIVDDLEPGTMYYVLVSSRNAAGMATSTPVLIITGDKKNECKNC